MEDDYSFRLFTKHYAQVILMEVIAENPNISVHKLMPLINLRSIYENAQDILWNVTYIDFQKEFDRCLVLLIHTGLVETNQGELLKLTNDGKKVLRDGPMQSAATASYYNYKSLQESRKIADINNEAVNAARKTAKWAMVAAIVAASGILIQLLLHIITISCKQSS